jgi:hypothetical protein
MGRRFESDARLHFQAWSAALVQGDVVVRQVALEVLPQADPVNLILQVLAEHLQA